MLPAASGPDAGRALSRQVTMMVDSEPTDRIESSPREPDLKPAGRKPGGRKPGGRGPSGRRVYRQGPVEDNAGWAIFSYLISGMVFYGLIGWLVGRATHIAALFPLGAITGLVLAIVLIILRYGRP
jgi:ATP synthase protein I